MNLFLVPASSENIRATIARSVDIEIARQHLNPAQFENLKRVLGSRRSFNCWAMTKSKISVFKSMNPGDIVLLSIRGTGRFDYKATVVTKLECRQFGESLWNVVPGKPWELIYVLEDVSRIELSKEKVVRSLGYRPNYQVPGVTRVKPEYMRNIANKYDSIDGFLNAMRNEERLH